MFNNANNNPHLGGGNSHPNQQNQNPYPYQNSYPIYSPSNVNFNAPPPYIPSLNSTQFISQNVFQTAFNSNPVEQHQVVHQWNQIPSNPQSSIPSSRRESLPFNIDLSTIYSKPYNPFSYTPLISPGHFPSNTDLPHLSTHGKTQNQDRFLLAREFLLNYLHNDIDPNFMHISLDSVLKDPKYQCFHKFYEVIKTVLAKKIFEESNPKLERIKTFIVDANDEKILATLKFDKLRFDFQPNVFLSLIFFSESSSLDLLFNIVPELIAKKFSFSVNFLDSSSNKVLHSIHFKQLTGLSILFLFQKYKLASECIKSEYTKKIQIGELLNDDDIKISIYHHAIENLFQCHEALKLIHPQTNSNINFFISYVVNYIFFSNFSDKQITDALGYIGKNYENFILNSSFFLNFNFIRKSKKIEDNAVFPSIRLIDIKDSHGTKKSLDFDDNSIIDINHPNYFFYHALKNQFFESERLKNRNVQLNSNTYISFLLDHININENRTSELQHRLLFLNCEEKQVKQLSSLLGKKVIGEFDANLFDTVLIESNDLLIKLLIKSLLTNKKMRSLCFFIDLFNPCEGLKIEFYSNLKKQLSFETSNLRVIDLITNFARIDLIEYFIKSHPQNNLFDLERLIRDLTFLEILVKKEQVFEFCQILAKSSGYISNYTKSWRLLVHSLFSYFKENIPRISNLSKEENRRSFFQIKKGLADLFISDSYELITLYGFIDFYSKIVELNLHLEEFNLNSYSYDSYRFDFLNLNFFINVLKKSDTNWDKRIWNKGDLNFHSFLIKTLNEHGLYGKINSEELILASGGNSTKNELQLLEKEMAAKASFIVDQFNIQRDLFYSSFKAISETSHTTSFHTHNQKLLKINPLEDLINHLKNCLHEKAFKKQLISQLEYGKGSWEFNIGNENEWILDPFINFLQSNRIKNREDSLEAIKIVIQFLNFKTSTISINSEILEQFKEGKDVSLINLIYQLIPSSSKEEQTEILPFELAQQLAPAFFELKWFELMSFISNFNYFIQLGDQAEKTIPVFFLSDTRTSCKMIPLIGHFNKRGQFSHFSLDKENSSKAHLSKLLNNHQISLSKNDSVLISLEDLQQLKQIANSASEFSFMILQKKNPIILEDVEMTDQMDSSKKRKKEILHTQKEKAENSKKVKTGLLTTQMEIEDEDAEPEEIKEMSITISKETIPQQSSAIDLKNPHTFWQNLSLIAINKAEKQVTRTLSKMEAQSLGHPLKYPVQSLIENFDPSLIPTSRPIDPLLKPYQIEVVSWLKEMERLKISPLLSSEMGTGKTRMCTAKLIKNIAEGKTGISLVLVPLHMLSETSFEINSVLIEAHGYAWRLLLTSQSNDPKLIDKFITKLTQARTAHFDKQRDFSQKHFAEMLYAFSLLPYERVSKYTHFFTFTNYHVLINTLEVMLKEHFEKVEQKCDKSPEIRLTVVKKIEQILDGFKSSNLPEQLITSLKQVLETKKPLNDPIMSSWITKIKDKIGSSENTVKHAYFKLAGSFFGLSFYESKLNPQQFSEEELRNVAEYPLALDGIDLKDASSFEKTISQNKNPSAIFVTSLEVFGKINESRIAKDDPNKSSLWALVEKQKFNTVIIDEAQRVHSKKTEYYSNFTQLLKPLKFNEVIKVTGTPFENSFSELWTLLEIGNEHLFLQSTHEALNNKFNQASEALLKGTIGWEEIILDAFAHYRTFSRLLSSTISRKQMNDPDVQRDWNYNTPKGEHLSIDLTRFIPQSTKREIEEIEKAANHTLSVDFKLARTLLHADFKNQTLEWNDKNINLYKNFKKNPQNYQKWIQDSPSIQALLKAPELQEFFQEKKKLVIFVSTIALGKFFKLAINTNYNAKNVEAKFYYADNSEKRVKKINWFRSINDQKGKTLIISIKSGSSGLNLPEADAAVKFTYEPNPSKNSQADARILRINSVGSKKLYDINFGTELDKHTKNIRDKKQAMESFLFNCQIPVKEHFKLFCRVLTTKLANDLFNKEEKTKKENQQPLSDKPKTWEEDIKDLENLLINWTNEIEEQELIDWVNKVTPHQPKPIVEPLSISANSTASAQNITMNGVAIKQTSTVNSNRTIPGDKFTIVPLTYSNENSLEDALKLALTLKDLVKGEFDKLILTLRKDVSYREMIRKQNLRSVNQANDAKILNHLLDLITFSKKSKLCLNKISIEIYEVRNNQYVLKEVRNPDQGTIVRVLLRKQVIDSNNNNSLATQQVSHYDLLYPF